MSLQAGVYIVENVKGGTALDLSHEDNKSTVGCAQHGGPSQQWEFTRLGAGWLIKNLNNGFYLNTEGRLGHYVQQVVHEFPTSWSVVKEPHGGGDVYRIRWPKSGYVLDLDLGKSADGTKVTICDYKQEVTGQLWRLIRFQGGGQSSTTVVNACGGTTTTTVTTITTTVTTRSC